ncbi:MAG: hypothetical protein ABFS37_10915, partial [Acidobacteriota bacterium]
MMKKSMVYLVVFAVGFILPAFGVTGAEEVERLAAPVGPIPEEVGGAAGPVVEEAETLFFPKANFDGNGFGDLAVGAPREDVSGEAMAGAVSAYYWTSGTTAPAAGDYWEQSDTGASASESDDMFGLALAVGDFNGDGVFDLAIGVPEEDWQGPVDAGIIQIFYGVSGTGLSLAGGQLWHQDSAGVNGALESGDMFGFSLAAGDFNGDGYDDLAIGVPLEDAGATNSGAVNILYGTSGGISATDDQLFTQSTFGLTEGGDEFFGEALAAGDFNGDGYDDLAVGAPGDEVFFEDRAGSVFVALGSSNRLTVAASGYWWHQDSTGVAGASEAFDGFGSALAAGDFDDDGFDDLVVGVPYEDLGNPVVANSGAVHVLYGSSGGTTATGETFLYQGFGNTSNGFEEDDQFGSSLAVGDFTGDGFDDLVVGVSDEDWNTIVDTGMIH